MNSAWLPSPRMCMCMNVFALQVAAGVASREQFSETLQRKKEIRFYQKQVCKVLRIHQECIGQTQPVRVVNKYVLKLLL